MTQSTLSAGLLALERQLDAPILDRAAGRHVVFTPLGLDLVERARDALTALEAVAEAAGAAREPMSGPLRLGVIPTIGPFLLPKLMPALRRPSRSSGCICARTPRRGWWTGLRRTGWTCCCWHCPAIAAARRDAGGARRVRRRPAAGPPPGR